MAKNKQHYTELPIFRAMCENICPSPEYEHRFHPVRRWRFDVAWLSKKIAVEIDGGVWIGGRHSGGMGQIKDNEKINVAQSLGWRVYRFVPGDIKSGYFLKAMQAIMGGREFPGRGVSK